MLFIYFFNFVALAHPGRTDSSGGHWNHETGTYHYHTGDYVGRSNNSSNSEKKYKSNYDIEISYDDEYYAELDEHNKKTFADYWNDFCKAIKKACTYITKHAVYLLFIPYILILAMPVIIFFVIFLRKMLK